MIARLSGLLTAFGLAGIGGFLFHLRQIAIPLPVFISLACVGLGFLTAIAAAIFGRQAATGLLRTRGTVVILVLCGVSAVVIAVAGALLQMAIGLAVANSLQINQAEYESIGIASTRLLTPSFFVVLHGVVCFGIGLAGLQRQSRALLISGLLVSMPTLYLLISYARAPM